ncbi:MAG: hypothetical protein V1861_00670 [Candidatus Micrarchaeota archaeon]
MGPPKTEQAPDLSTGPTRQQTAAAQSQLFSLQLATGILGTPLQLTRSEREHVLADATSRSGTFLGPSRELVMDRVTREFAQVLRARGDSRSVELAGRIERLRGERLGTETPSVATRGPRGLTAEAERDIRALATTYGVDSDYLLREVRTATVRVSRDSSGNTSVAIEHSHIDPADPQQYMKSVAQELASDILFRAHGSGTPFSGSRRTADFSEANILAAAADFNSVERRYYPSGESVSFTAIEIRDPTTRRWLNGEATRLGVRPDELTSAVLNYAAISQGGSPELAETYLSRCGLSGRASEFVRIAAERMNSQRLGDGPLRFSLTTTDIVAIRSEMTRTDRLRRVA